MPWMLPRVWSQYLKKGRILGGINFREAEVFFRAVLNAKKRKRRSESVIV